MSYHPIANQIYNLLIQDIANQEGEITFNFLNISVKINEKSAIGDLFQEWLTEWMRLKGVEFRTKTNTQEFPDFLLDISDTTGLLEIKTFNYDDNASFDVANFKAYCRSLKTEAHRLDADYLIFAYELKDYKFKVRKIWLKKIWEITGGSANYSVKCNVKQHEIDAIRPVVWYSKSQKARKPFKSRFDFVEGLYDTLMKYPGTQNQSYDWLATVKNNYFYHIGEEL
ncbi:hypothetical protein BMF77_03412 [Dolichospermum sp. UHCC 0315A]|jgi:hypothetical protein|uniref:NgoBV family restriction endonuclease n=1 Tax=Dolichospermum TaxID=748770 RepID=UPI0011E73722|nr:MULTISPECIES: NgoBV family restriction endonuclease [Dolichospermum]MDB9438510.1 NgoBV family restriction endonuclease [Dolichospermum lemmermannii CS-548]QEI42800.1 hypothetical protein BMF77_03412 [Dolichospermum sp. UHCC 0315A]